MDMVKKLLLVDGSAIIHRAYHAMPDLTDRKGRPSGAVYGVARMMVKAITDMEPTHLIVALDRREPTFRKQLFIGYQAQRPSMEPELVDQYNRARELFDLMKIMVLDKVGYEADDVIGTVTHKAIDDGFEFVEIVTGDKDLMQLVDDKVKLFVPQKGMSETAVYDRQAVYDKLGVWPEQVVDFKALTGDNSDNYPGVHGIGPKTAAFLLAKFKEYPKIWEHLEEVPEKHRFKLEQGREGGDLSYDLARIRIDVDVDFKWEDCVWTEKEEAMREAFGEFGFKSLEKEMVAKQEKEAEKEQLGLF